jgi:hypothetical protein
MRKFCFLIAILFALVALPVYSATGGGTVTVAASIPTHAKPTAGLAGGGAGKWANGAHYVKCAYVTSKGTTIPGTASDVVTVTDYTSDGKISVTLVASARTEVTSINIYATKAGGSTYYLAKSGNANSNGAVVVDLATSEAVNLTVVAPTTDTASEAANTTITCTSGKHFTSLWVRNADATNRCYITLDGTDPITSATVGSWSVGAAVTWGPLELLRDRLGNSPTSIKMRFDTTGGVVSYWYTEDM